MGDKVNLGFVAATEEQVCKHLDEHLQKLSKQDEKSRAILSQMKIDETRHMHRAQDAGAAQFPLPVRSVMTAISKLMTRSTYWI
jgi:ubiquinone biosynthesis monooxygenase Coq7